MVNVQECGYTFDFDCFVVRDGKIRLKPVAVGKYIQRFHLSKGMLLRIRDNYKKRIREQKIKDVKAGKVDLNDNDEPEDQVYNLPGPA